MPRSARDAKLETRSARAKLAARKAPYFVKVAKGLQLGYYRGGSAGTWVGRRYVGAAKYETHSIGVADDTIEADGAKVLTYFEAQEALRRWGERRRLFETGPRHRGHYKVSDAVRDYLDEIQAEKSPAAVKKIEYIFNASVLPELGNLTVDSLSFSRISQWRNNLATRPKRVRRKRAATEPATRPIADDDDARRKRRATANRVLSQLKAALNRAFRAGHIASDAAWRKVAPFKRVDEPVIRYLTTDEARRLVSACPLDFCRLVQAALLTGCRYSELTRSTCADFDQHAGTLAVRQSKGGKSRHVVLTEDACDLFASWTAGHPKKARIFLRDDGDPWGPSHQQRPIADASEAARISPPATFHVLRHTHASHLAMAGTPMGVIAVQLGHVDTRMVEKHYAHLAPSYVADTIRAKLPALGVIGKAAAIVSIESARKAR
jgi:integrase